MVAYSVVGAQWILFGYSLAFADNSNSSFIGNLSYGALRGVESQGLSIAPAIPEILFALYQMQFATITAAIIFGSVVERIRFIPSMVFIFIWATLVYCPVTYWTWANRGWLRNLSCLSSIGSKPCGLGVFDYAGGGPVEICSGASALALTLVVGKRSKPGSPHNLLNVNIATGLLWFGWYGFNAGSALSSVFTYLI
jgi:Amt family ammonium transporter